MLSGFLHCLGYVVASVLLGQLSVIDPLGVDAERAASRAFRRALNAEPNRAADLAAAR
jgi:hypothetical protein